MPAAAACALQVAALRQRAALLQVYSLALLRYKLPSMLEPLLAVLVGPGSGVAATAAGAAGYSNSASAALHPYASASGTAALLALQHICGVALPQQGIEIPAELQQIQQEMTVDDISVAALLSQPSVMESAGVVTTDEYGQPVFDFAVSLVFCTRPGLLRHTIRIRQDVQGACTYPHVTCWLWLLVVASFRCGSTYTPYRPVSIATGALL